MDSKDTGMWFSIIGNKVGLGNALLKRIFHKEKSTTHYPDDSITLDGNNEK